MKFLFNAERGLILVTAEVLGPSGTAFMHLAIDTGATTTLLNSSLLATVGYDVAASAQRIEVTTGSGVEIAAALEVRELSVLGHKRKDFLVLAHTLPASARLDGLLGLDFLRGLTLTTDFRIGLIELS